MATSSKSRAQHADPPGDPGGAVVNTFAGGLVEIVQAARGGHRAGLEALLLAAAVDCRLAGAVVDLGSGVGAIGFTIAARCPDTRVVLVDSEADLLACAAAALDRPANRRFADRVRLVRADVGWPAARLRAVGLEPASADLVVSNPPFQIGREGASSPDPERRAAHELGLGGLAPWIDATAMLLKPGGVVLLISASGRLDEIMRLFAPGTAAEAGFGAIDLLPVQGRPRTPARRVLVRAVKGSRRPVRLFPPLVLHGEVGPDYLSEVEPVLRGRAGLADIHPLWH